MNRRTDAWTDGQTDHCRAPGEQGPNKWYLQLISFSNTSTRPRRTKYIGLVNQSMLHFNDTLTHDIHNTSTLIVRF